MKTCRDCSYRGNVNGTDGWHWPGWYCKRLRVEMPCAANDSSINIDVYLISKIIHPDCPNEEYQMYHKLKQL